jgi:hypothetical protein
MASSWAGVRIAWSAELKDSPPGTVISSSSSAASMSSTATVASGTSRAGTGGGSALVVDRGEDGALAISDAGCNGGVNAGVVVGGVKAGVGGSGYVSPGPGLGVSTETLACYLYQKTYECDLHSLDGYRRILKGAEEAVKAVLRQLWR